MIFFLSHERTLVLLDTILTTMVHYLQWVTHWCVCVRAYLLVPDRLSWLLVSQPVQSKLGTRIHCSRQTSQGCLDFTLRLRVEKSLFNVVTERYTLSSPLDKSTDSMRTHLVWSIPDGMLELTFNGGAPGFSFFPLPVYIITTDPLHHVLWHTCTVGGFPV